MGKKLKIGVIGCGNMAQSAHLPCLAALDTAELTCLYDPRTEVAEKVAARWGIGKVCSKLSELLDESEAVLVLTPGPFHLSNITDALNAGKHVFTEKPLAMCEKSARELTELADKAGVMLQVGYMKQHDDNIRTLLEMRAQKDWGKLLFARAHSFVGSGWNAEIKKLFPMITGDAPEADFSAADYGPEWLDDKRDATFYSFDNPYFALLDTGCHSVNLLRFVTGKDFSVSAVRNSGRVRQVDFDLDGVPAVMEFCINFAMKLFDEVTELYFEKATVKIKTPPPLAVNTSATIEIYTDSDKMAATQTLQDCKRWPFANQLEFFVESILSGKIINNGSEAVKDISIIENIYKEEKGKK